ncbi:MAG: hypothetical protein AAGA23_11990 [Pseudomonadota bacterium]
MGRIGVAVLVLTGVAGGIGYWLGSQATSLAPAAPAAETSRLTPTGVAGPPALCETPAPRVAPRSAPNGADSPAGTTASCDSPYAGLGPLDLLALPTDFDQTLALYSIAGEADLAGLRQYMEDSLSIALENERNAALSILFMRYGDLDPDGAIAQFEALGLTGNSTVLYPLFSSWSKQDLDGAITRARSLNFPRDRQTASRAIMRAHASESPETIQRIASDLNTSLASLGPQALAARARTEPMAAARTALALEDANARRQALGWIASTWAESDVDAALRFAKTITNPADQTAFRYTALARLAERDPETLLARLGDGPRTPQDNGLATTAMMHLARKNPERALNLALEQTPGQRQSAVQRVFSSWAQADPRAAAEGLETATDLTAQERLQAAGQVVSQLAQADPEAALTWASQLDRESPQANHWYTAIASVPQLDHELAWSIVDQEPSAVRRGAMTVAVLGKMAEMDPLGAVDRLEALPAGENRSNAISGIAQQWIQHDPASAMDWLLSLGAQERSNAVTQLGWSLAQLDLDLAASYLPDLSEQEAQHWLGSLMHHYLQRSPFDAAAWLEQYPNIQGHGERMGQVAAALASQDPRAAWKLVDEIEERRQRDRAMAQLAAGWSQADPRGAGKWWHRLEDADQTGDVLGSLVSGWASVDPDGARKWILRLKEDAHRDQALTQYLGQTTLEPGAAGRLILDIQDESQRYQAYQMVAWRIAQYDRDAARAWVAEARLPSDKKNVLISEFERQN